MKKKGGSEAPKSVATHRVGKQEITSKTYLNICRHFAFSQKGSEGRREEGVQVYSLLAGVNVAASVWLSEMVANYPATHGSRGSCT